MRRNRSLDLEERNSPLRNPEEPFPLVLLATASVAMAGVYYQLLIDIPDQLTRGELRHLGAGWCRLFEIISMTVGATPFLAVPLFIGLLAPGLLWRAGARRYFLTVTMAALALWTVVFVVAGEPAKRVGAAIHELSLERTLPDPLAGGAKGRR